MHDDSGSGGLVVGEAIPRPAARGRARTLATLCMAVLIAQIDT